ncbi:hypothetical protein FPOAC2_07641 [Fusarium poae]
MPDQHPSSTMEARVAPSLTLQATLSDGTSINVTFSPASAASSALTASTTLTTTSCSFEINTSLPTNTASLDKASQTFQVKPASQHSSSSASLSSAKPSKTFHASFPPTKDKHPSNMSVTLPSDVVAIDTTKKSVLFYVAPDQNNDNRLSYLESPNAKGTGNYTVEKIDRASIPGTKKYENILVSEKNKQVAAVTWIDGGGVQIRVYYVARGTENLREVCKTGDGEWYIGALGQGSSRKIFVRENTSISASVHDYGSKGYNLRVFAAEKDQINGKRLPQIGVFKFVHDENAEDPPHWGDVNYITDQIEEY